MTIMNSPLKLLRGGSWYYDSEECRSASRDGGFPDIRDGNRDPWWYGGSAFRLPYPLDDHYGDLGFRVCCLSSKNIKEPQ